MMELGTWPTAGGRTVGGQSGSARAGRAQAGGVPAGGGRVARWLPGHPPGGGGLSPEPEADLVQHVLDQVGDAVFLLDRDTLRILHGNRGALEQTGCGPAALTRLALYELTPELGREDLAATFAGLCQAGSGTRRRMTVLRPVAGPDRAVELVVQAPAGRPGGDPPPYVAIARDLTDTLRAEATAREAATQAAISADHERIARDLHDRVIQRIFAAGLILDGALGHLRGRAVAERVRDAADELDGAIRELRDAIFGLEVDRPAVGRIREELADLVAEYGRLLGFGPRVHFQGPLDTLPAIVLPQVAAALREMLSNVARHARAHSVSVDVALGDDLRVEVADDGDGVPGPVRSGNGLRNLRARAQSLGGTFTVSGRLPSGTVAVWSVPVTGPGLAGPSG